MVDAAHASGRRGSCPHGRERATAGRPSRHAQETGPACRGRWPRLPRTRAPPAKDTGLSPGRAILAGQAVPGEANTFAMSNQTIVPVVLSGGSGTRLWPVSRESFPKQLWPLLSEHSLLQDTVLRGRGPGFAAPIVVC